MLIFSILVHESDSEAEAFEQAMELADILFHTKLKVDDPSLARDLRDVRDVFGSN